MTLPVLADALRIFLSRRSLDDYAGRQKLSRYGALWIVAALYLAFATAIMGGSQASSCAQRSPGIRPAFPPWRFSVRTWEN
jgi:hypothetical protein